MYVGLSDPSLATWSLGSVGFVASQVGPAGIFARWMFSLIAACEGSHRSIDVLSKVGDMYYGPLTSNGCASMMAPFGQTHKKWAPYFSSLEWMVSAHRKPLDTTGGSRSHAPWLLVGL